MKISVTAGPHTYENCPLTAPVVVNDLGSGEATLVATDGSRIPCQLFTEHGAAMVAWIERKLKPGETKSYRLETASAGAASNVEIEDIGDGKLEVRIGGKLVTRYHYGPQEPKPYLHPFIGPNQTPVTRGYPMIHDIPGETTDHSHHRSVWVAYGDVNGSDNWTEQEGHGYQRHLRFEEVTGGPVFGRIRAVNSWTNKDGAKQMEDVREFTFYNVEPERLVDVTVTFAATEGDVELGDTKEGGIIAVRVASSMDGKKDGMIENSYGGKTEAETWGRPAHWVDYYGPVKGRTMGITIMDHRLSFRHPSRWMVRDYGMFTANPFALKAYEPGRGFDGSHTIKKADELFFKYRLYVHEGNTEQAECSERYFGFIAPPKVEVS